MRVLLIDPNYGFHALAMKATPLGLLSIATYLKQRGVCVRIYDRNVDKASLEGVVREFRPDAVGVSVVTMLSIRDGAAVSRRLRARGLPVIWGGFMATIAMEMALREGAADYVVAGEGEITFHALLQAIEAGREPSQVKGIAYMDASGRVRRTPEREFADMEKLPRIDFSFVDPRNYFCPQQGCTKMLYLCASKGCPGRCAFCFNRGFHRSICRQRPVEYVISEIEELAAKYGMDGVYFTDEMFGADKRAMAALCDRLQALRPRVVWGCSTRLCHFSRAEFQRMYDAGCRWIYFGIESGSPDMLSRIHKRLDPAQIDTDLRHCREIGIYTHCGIIVGLPDETETQLRESVELMLRIDTDRMQATSLLPMPGSEIYEALVGSGKLAPARTLREWETLTPIEGVYGNFSRVPSLDLHVIQCFFLWRSFFQKFSAKDAPRHKFKPGAVLSSLRGMLPRGFVNGVRYVFSSAGIFFTIAWYRYAYPGVRKKYGLSTKKP